MKCPKCHETKDWVIKTHTKRLVIIQCCNCNYVRLAWVIDEE